MSLIQEGRVCVITKGADAGKEVVIKQVVDKNFVIITGEKVKERKSNVKHLEPINKTAKAPAGKKITVKEKKAQVKKAGTKKTKETKKAEKPAVKKTETKK